MKKTVPKSEWISFLGKVDSVFTVGEDVSLSLSTYLASQNFDCLPDEPVYDEQYLKIMKDSLVMHPNHPLYLNNIGNYYSNTFEPVEANKYYKKALEFWTIEYSNNDSSELFTTRAFLKLVLGMDDVIEDAELAYKINPKNEVAKMTLVFIYFSKQEFDKLKAFSKSNILEGVMYPQLDYVFLIMSDMTEFIQKNNDIIKDLNLFIDKCNSTHFADLLNIPNYDSLLSKYNNDIELENLRKLTPLAGLVIQSSLYLRGYEYKIPDEEIRDIEELKTWLIQRNQEKKLNDYSYYLSLGYIEFGLNNFSNSIENLEKAIEAFPTSKQHSNFNLFECYGLITALYYKQNRKMELINFLEIQLDKAITPAEKLYLYNKLALINFKQGKNEEAEKWAIKAFELNYYDFESVRLLIHLNFIKGHFVMVDYYSQRIMNNTKTENENYLISLQYALYHIINGNANDAAHNLINCKEIDKDNKLVNEILDEYLEKISD